MYEISTWGTEQFTQLRHRLTVFLFINQRLIPVLDVEFVLVLDYFRHFLSICAVHPVADR